MRSTNIVYQQKGSILRKWCRDEGVSAPTNLTEDCWLIIIIAYIRQKRNLSTPSTKRYRSMLSYVLRLKLPEISSSPILEDLIRSFSLQNKKLFSPPSWDLNKVLNSLMSPPFYPLQEATLRNITRNLYSYP